LKIVNQSGKTSPLPSNPPSNDDWTVETALDLDMASAACPKCKLLLVQADNDSGNGLYTAQATAVALGATVISNSWGGAESKTSPSTASEKYFNHSGVATFVAAGDDGYDDGGQGPDYPGTSAYVFAVGGTKLAKSTSNPRGWVEGAWSTSSGNGAGGSACSYSIPKPSWQKNSACKYKASSDVAAVGDPSTGPSVYNAANGGWTVVGGTSAAAPFVAGVFALTGHGKESPSFAYANSGAFYDVTTGSNGTCGNVLCNAGAGWDGPTGMGTPNGSVLKGASTCTPACTGKTCGDDGCGGTCGTCATGTSCNSSGACVKSTCTPSCTGKTCGSDGCGGTCGTCSAGSSCSTAGQCTSTNTCTHAICSTGKALKTACDKCVKTICASDSYCCSTSWDSTCVGEVASICSQTCQ
jgi:hypothetical protein